MKELIPFGLLFAAYLAEATVNVTPGEKVQEGKAPFVASLSMCSMDECRSHCTAVVVSDQYILSTAQCAGRPRTVLVGVVDFETKERYDSYWTNDRVIHPNYTADTMDNDISLFKIGRPLVLGDKYQALPLAKQGQLPTGDPVEIYGYATVADPSASLNVARNQTVLNPQTSKACQEELDLRLRSDNAFCSTPSLVTWGDRGGPVVQNGVLIGILSVPSYTQPSKVVFTPIHLHADWINSVIKKKE